MANETEFVNGLIVKAPREGAPEYVKAQLSIKREELAAWLQTKDGDWINVDVKESQQGKWYAAVNTWKPDKGNGSPRNNAPQPQRRQPEPSNFDSGMDSEIPFISARGVF